MENIVLIQENIMGYVGLIFNMIQKIWVRKIKIDINANLLERMEIDVEIMVFRLKMAFVVCINPNDIFVILFSIFYIVLHI